MVRPLSVSPIGVTAAATARVPPGCSQWGETAPDWAGPRYSLAVRAGADLDSKALREAREARGLTQHQLARLIGVAGGERVARWERGASRPMPRLVHAMAEALEVSVGFLLAEERAGLTLRGLRVRSGLTAEQVATMSLMSADTYRHWRRATCVVLPRTRRWSGSRRASTFPSTTSWEPSTGSCDACAGELSTGY